MKAIVTGATGLIGSRFVELYAPEFETIYSISRHCENFGNIKAITHDFSSSDPIDFPEVDVIFHFAAQTSATLNASKAIEDFMINANGTLKLLDAAVRNSPNAFFINIGTATQLGYTSELCPKTDLPKDDPTTFYDISKLVAERYVLQFAFENFLRGCSLRLCNVYGGLNKSQKFDRGILDKVFYRCLNGERVFVYGDGMFYRDYVHVDDVVRAAYAAFKAKDSLSGTVHYIGTGQSVYLRHAFEMIAEEADKYSSRISMIETSDIPLHLNPIELRNFQADISEFSKLSGWLPQITFREGIAQSYSGLNKSQLIKRYGMNG